MISHSYLYMIWDIWSILEYFKNRNSDTIALKVSEIFSSDSVTTSSNYVPDLDPGFVLYISWEVSVSIHPNTNHCDAQSAMSAITVVCCLFIVCSVYVECESGLNFTLAYFDDTIVSPRIRLFTDNQQEFGFTLKIRQPAEVSCESSQLT